MTEDLLLVDLAVTLGSAPPLRWSFIVPAKMATRMTALFVLGLGMCWLSASTDAANQFQYSQHEFDRLISSILACKTASRTADLACVIEQVCFQTITHHCAQLCGFDARCRNIYMTGVLLLERHKARSDVDR